MDIPSEPLPFIGDLLPPGAYRAIQDTKPLMAVLPSMDREEIETGVLALRLSAGRALAPGACRPGDWEIAQLAFWLRWLSGLSGAASPLDGPGGRNALCVYLAEKINDVWRARPDIISQPCNWPHAGQAATMTLAEACAAYGVLPHPGVLDPLPRELIRSQLAQPQALRLASQGSHCFILEFAAGTPAGLSAVANALLTERGIDALAAAALGRYEHKSAGASPLASFLAEDSLNARCAAALLHAFAQDGVLTPEPQVGWIWDQPEQYCVLQLLGSRAVDVALSRRPLRGLLPVLRDAGRIVGHGEAGSSRTGRQSSLALDFCRSVARELLDRAHARWRTNAAGDFVVDAELNHYVAMLLLRHDGAPSFVEQYVDVLVRSGMSPDDFAIPSGPQIPGVAYGPLDKPMSFRDVFYAVLPPSCLALFESRSRECAMSSTIAAAHDERTAAARQGEAAPRRRRVTL